MTWKVTYLPNTFMITALIGFLFSALFIMPRSMTWGFTMLLFFSVMFIASFISVVYGPVVREQMPRR